MLYKSLSAVCVYTLKEREREREEESGDGSRKNTRVSREGGLGWREKGDMCE